MGVSKKDGKWVAEYSIVRKGKPRKRFQHTASTRKAAETWLADARRGLAKPKHNSRARTVHDLAEYYYSTASFIELRKTSQGDIRRRIKTFLDWCDKKNIHAAWQVTREVARTYEAYLVSEAIVVQAGKQKIGYERKGIESRLIEAGKLFNRDLERDVPAVRMNPFKGIRRGKKIGRKIAKVVSPDVFTLYARHMTRRELAICKVLYGAGLRIGEFHNLEWTKVTPDVIFIVGNEETGWDPKTGEEKPTAVQTDVSREGFEVLREYTGGQKYVLLGKRAAGPQYISHMIANIRKRMAERGIDVPHVTAHQFRATFVTELLRNKVSIYDASLLARHRNPKTTADNYSGYTYVDLIEPASQLPSPEVESGVQGEWRKSRKSAS